MVFLPSIYSGDVCAQRRIPTEEELVSEIAQAGFYGVEIQSWGDAPLHLFEGIEIRNFTVRAFKGKEGNATTVIMPSFIAARGSASTTTTGTSTGAASSRPSVKRPTAS
jgi:hypothetical protein